VRKHDPRTTAQFNRTFSRLIRLGVVLAVAVPLVGVASGADASPTTDIRTVQAKVDTLRHDAEVASENFNDTREQLKGLQVRVKAAQTRLDAQRARVQLARRMVGRLAAESYRNGDLGTLELYLGDDPDLLLAQSGVVETLADRQITAIQRLKESQRKLAADTAELGRQKAKIAAAEAKLGQTKKTVEAKLAAAQALLSRLTGAQRRALERASRDAARKALENTPNDPNPAPDPTPTGGSKMTCGDVGVAAPTAQVKKVLDYACAQLGDPYVWGADGPGSFDCSGLVLASWRQGGVSLPHSSRMQATYGTRISLSNARAGDLIFYYSPISHVGIIIGKGLMIHAPHSGDVVRIAPLHSGSITAVVRL
jgi:cell wall-associated NlpC family hydrolase